jgi:hypothetical protein
MTNSFRFMNDSLNRRLLKLLKSHGIKFIVDRQGSIHYSSSVETAFSKLVSRVRNSAFPEWQLLTFPTSWKIQYTNYMAEHSIPYFREIANGRVWYLLAKRYRPHRWKL